MSTSPGLPLTLDCCRQVPDVDAKSETVLNVLNVLLNSTVLLNMLYSSDCTVGCLYQCYCEFYKSDCTVGQICYITWFNCTAEHTCS